MGIFRDVLVKKGVDASGIASAVKEREAAQQAAHKAFNLERIPKEHHDRYEHDSELHGLNLAQVESIVREHLGDQVFEFCGREFAAELWEDL